MISPVGLSSIIISISFKLSEEPSFIFESTDLKIPNDFILSIDLLYNRELSGSPSSTTSLLRITSSIVLKFPKIFIFST